MVRRIVTDKCICYAAWEEKANILSLEIKKELEKPTSKYVAISRQKISEIMGKEFDKKSLSNIFWVLRCLLFNNGLWVEKKIKKFLIVRKLEPTDELSEILRTKYVKE